MNVGTGMTLIGRTGELALIEGALGDLERGRSRVFAISGEPGIGKTRLLSELRSRAAKRGYTVLSGRGTELEGEVPFGVFVEALDGILGSLDRRRLQAIGKRLPHLAGVFPAVGSVAAELPGPAVERYRNHRAIRELLQELAVGRPLVLALDDVQWADAASAETLAYLLRKPPSAGVLLALSHRRGQAPAILSDALEAALRETRDERVILGPLSEQEAFPLLADEPDAQRRREIFVEGGGNPFYIEQLMRAAPAPRDPAAAGAQHLGADRLPIAVVSALEEELRHLTPGARQMLEGAAVAGEPFEPELAAEAAGIESELALPLLDELLACDCVRPDAAARRFRFRHPIVRRAVYDSIPPGRCLAAHGRAAQALRQLSAPAAQRAHHVALPAAT